MAMLGTPTFFAKMHIPALAWSLLAAVGLAACAADHEDGSGGTGLAGNAGTTGGAGTTGTTGGSGGTGGTGGTSGGDGDGDGDGDAGPCDDRGCFVTLAAFQAEALNCATTYEMAQSEYQQGPGEDCVYAFFECGGLDGAAYQYGPTGDNVQCYYDDNGALVGAVRTSDHGPSTMTGEVPEERCYNGPDCDPGSGIPDLRDCEVTSDCVLSPTQCCPCGQPEPNQVTAVRADRRAAFFDDVCPPPVACPDIYCPPEPPRFVATCNAGACAVVDLNEQAAIECDAPTDCRVRAVACCECNAMLSPGSLVAVSDEAAFTSLVCDPTQACEECAPSYPAEVTATCSPFGLCELNDPRQ